MTGRVTADPCLISDLQSAFHPKAVAVVGVSRDDVNPPPGYTGLRIFRQFREEGFEGRLYPINPRATVIDDVPAFPSISAVPERLDLVIITIPARGVPQVLEDCIANGAVNVHICTAGFGETGEAEGKAIEDRVREIVRRGHLRVVGPNSMGYHVPASRMKMYAGVQLTAGPVAFVSQSGGHAQNFTGHGPALGIGFSKVISYGNALAMDGTDFLEYLAGDPETRIICVYLEGVKDGHRLVQLARDIGRTKPLIVWKGGLTDFGARAAVTHTASIAGDDRLWRAFFRQTGAVQVGSIEEMADAAMTFLRLKPISRSRVAVIGGGGGGNVATGDICAQEGVSVPPLAGETRRSLLSLLPPVNQSIVNPIDGPAALYNPALLGEVLGALTASPDLDAVVLHVATALNLVTTAESRALLKSCISGFGARGSGKPVVVAVEGLERTPADVEDIVREMRDAGITTYSSLRAACRSLKRVADYYSFQAGWDSGPRPPKPAGAAARSGPCG